MTDLPDVQNTPSNYNIYLHEVGISDLKLPIMFLQKDGKFQQTIAEIDCFVDLAPEIKGISMSRLLEVLHSYTFKPLNSNVLKDILLEIKNRSESNATKLIIKFPYFLQKQAPVSGLSGYVHHNVGFIGTLIDGVSYMNYLVEVTATSLCPCSKEISDYSAHNQKCIITVNYTTNKWVWIEDVINICEKSASCEIYSILKRPDEKYITERAYNNPLFVEDINRNVHNNLHNIDGISTFDISVVSDESIHQHKAISKSTKGLNIVCFK